MASVQPTYSKKVLIIYIRLILVPIKPAAVLASKRPSLEGSESSTHYAKKLKNHELEQSSFFGTNLT